MATASSTPQPGAGLLGQVYVVANSDTNALLVMTLPKYFPKVQEMIRQLDRPIPQVLIRVLIAEVTHDDTVDLGAEFSILNLTSAAAGSRGGQLFTNVAELPGPAAGGLVFKTLNKDFSATIRALETIGKLDVLSRPYILASDNQKANFQDVVQYPFASGSRVDVNGNVDTTVTWQTLGIILNVTPHINPDGVVTMLINPEIDTLTGQTVQIQAPSSTSPGLSEQVWGKRIATSQVAVRNGQTIVIGGMIQDQKTDTINKVPFLGDIPLIGRAFQHTVTAKTKTEVLIFLTPMVAMSPQELKALSKVEEESAGKVLEEAVQPGTFQQHLDAMRAQVPQQAMPPMPPSRRRRLRRPRRQRRRLIRRRLKRRRLRHRRRIRRRPSRRRRRRRRLNHRRRRTSSGAARIGACVDAREQPQRRARAGGKRFRPRSLPGDSQHAVAAALEFIRHGLDPRAEPFRGQPSQEGIEMPRLHGAQFQQREDPRLARHAAELHDGPEVEVLREMPAVEKQEVRAEREVELAVGEGQVGQARRNVAPLAPAQRIIGQEFLHRRHPDAAELGDGSDVPPDELMPVPPRLFHHLRIRRGDAPADFVRREPIGRVR